MLKLDEIERNMVKVFFQYYNEMIGYVYISKCIITNKVYIGITIQKYKKRWKDHIKFSFNPNNCTYNHYFHRAIRKYGKDSFEWNILEKVVANTKEELTQKLKDLEIKYINYYDSYKNGYNMTKGGDTSRKECKSINVYNDKGKIINTFDNVSEASAYYNISKSAIWQCCGKFSYYCTWNNSKIIFRYTYDILTDDELKIIEKIHYNSSINMYDLSGNLIKTFLNITAAAKELNINNERIIANCLKRTSFVLVNTTRYIFRYIDSTISPEELSKANNIKSNPKSAVIAIDSITNEVLGKFKSQSEAAKFFNINSHNISEVCSGKRKTAGKYNDHAIKWIKS